MQEDRQQKKKEVKKRYVCLSFCLFKILGLFGVLLVQNPGSVQGSVWSKSWVCLVKILGLFKVLFGQNPGSVQGFCLVKILGLFRVLFGQNHGSVLGIPC